MPEWDPHLYLQFGSERTQPSIDLVSRVPLANPGRVIDLGCGPGNSTRILRDRWPSAKIAGLDGSGAMITQAQESTPDLEWFLCDIDDWQPAHEYDLIFSNAALQWLPRHGELFARLAGYLPPSGVLAVQLPYHYDSPLHQVVEEVSRDSAWSDRMDSARGVLTHHPSGFYYDVLQPLCSSVQIWETEYLHNMESPAAILDWIRGTGLRPFLESLQSDDERAEFERQVLDGYTKAFPKQKDGRVLFPFRRQFFVAVR